MRPLLTFCAHTSDVVFCSTTIITANAITARNAESIGNRLVSAEEAARERGQREELRSKAECFDGVTGGDDD